MLLNTAVHALNMTTQLAACGESLLTFCALVRSFTWKHQSPIAMSVHEISLLKGSQLPKVEINFFTCVSL
jgi:hypothetical protein